MIDDAFDSTNRNTPMTDIHLQTKQVENSLESDLYLSISVSRESTDATFSRKKKKKVH